MTRLTGVLVLNRRVRNRTYGGVVGRGEPLLIPDKLHWEIRPRWSSRKIHPSRARDDYLGFITFQLVQGWGQGQEQNLSHSVWIKKRGLVSNTLPNNLTPLVCMVW